MGAQYTALRALMFRSAGLPTAQLGFPYVDTLKIQQKFGYDNFLLHNLSRIGEDLLTLVENQPLAGCFCEIPGNPQLGCADLRVVSPLLRRKNVPLVVDDVVATPYNINVGPYADLIATSLTKFLAGTGDVMMAGTLGRALCTFTVPVVTVMFPKIVRSAALSEKSNIMGLTLMLTGGLVGLGAFALGVVAPVLLVMVGKPDYVNAAPLVRWFALSMPFLLQ